VFHHEAHASVLAGEFGALNEDLLVLAWDGVGYGRDGTLWGGETLFGRPGAWSRVASLRAFRLPGGDQAVRQPWRSAQSIAWHAGFDWPDAPEIDPLLQHAWAQGLASPWTSAAGRLFDAAACLVGLGHESSYEGQGPSRLEALAVRGQPCVVPEIPLRTDTDGLARADWAELMDWMADSGIPAADRALGFHVALAELAGRLTAVLAIERGITRVGLTGGVFQNALLTQLAIAAIERAGATALVPEQVPVNDAGIAYGQVIELAADTGAGPAQPSR